MTGPAVGDGPARLDQLWRPAHWRDRVGGEPLDGFFAGTLAAAVVWNLVGNLWLPGSAYVAANLVLVAMLLGAARRAGLSFAELGLSRTRLARGAAVGAVAAAVVAAVLAVAVVAPPLRGVLDDPEIAANGAATDVYTSLIRIPLGTVVLEELLFRGVLLALALRRWPVRTAVLVTAGIFGLWHIVPAAEGASGGALGMLGAVAGTVVVTAGAGVAFSWLRLRANSVVAPALAHIATNSFAYLAVVLAWELR